MSGFDPVSVLAQADAPPAGGAAIGEVVVVTLAVSLLIGGLLALGLALRSGRLPAVRGFARLIEKGSGLPAWAAIPAGIVIASLLPAFLGLVWDVSLHIDDGRDEGPLANPSHFFLLYGLLGTFTAGWLALVLPEPGTRPGRAAVRITRTWHVPAGGLLLLGGASLALTGFPLDDVSHRLFGQDVTLWGTTHLQMITGAIIAVLATCVLVAEGAAARGARDPLATRPRVRGPVVLRVFASSRLRVALMTGGLLAGLSVYQLEFDFGVPQFRLLFHPVIIATAAAFALVLARQLAGRGGALLALPFYLVLNGLFTLIVGPVLGETTAHFPLYVAEALLVEAAALAVAPRARPWRFAAIAGLLVGTLGVVAEHGWSHTWMPIPWPDHLLVGAIVASVPCALAGAVLATFAAGGMSLRRDLVLGRGPAVLAVGALGVIAATFVWLSQTTAPAGRAEVTLDPVTATGGEREVVATVRIKPASVAEDPDWLTTIAWQGKAKLRVEPLREIGPGLYRSAPLPVSGSWKTAIRLHRGTDMAGVPIYLPSDSAIPIGEVPALARFERPFGADQKLLQRERREDVSELAVGAFSALVLGLIVAFLLLTGGALRRLARAGAEPVPPRSGTPARPGYAPADRRPVTVGAP